MSVEIKIKYFDGAEPLKQIEQGDWIDLRVNEKVILHRGDTYKLRLGVAMELPSGYEAIIAPRSSTFAKWGFIVTNSIGIIDESYKGDNDEWCLPIMAFRNVLLEKGSRVAQFRIIEHQPEIKFETVQRLGNEDRGGFGSTGEK